MANLLRAIWSILLVASFTLSKGHAAFSQEVVLKDGKRISWKTITDHDDRIEIVTTAGKKTTARKADIARITTTAAPDVPAVLTGASVSFGKRTKKADLLRVIQPKRDTVVGDWKASGGTLQNKITRGAGGPDFQRIMLDYPMPEEYDLHVTVERTGGTKFFGVGLIGGGRQFLFPIDRRTRLSGIWMLDRQDLAGQQNVKIGETLLPRKPRNFVFMVRKAGLVVTLDGKDWFSWKGDWSRVGLVGHIQIPRKDLVFLAAHDGEFRIRRLLLVIP